MMTDKSHFRVTGSHLPLPQRKKRHASDGPETPPPPPPPRDRSVTDIADISGKRKQPPSLPLRPEVSNDVSRWERSGGRHWSIDDRKHVVSCLSRATDEIRTADVVALSPVEFFRPCRDDLYISNDIVGKNGDFGAPGAKRTSSFFVSGRSASADCGELRMSAAVTMSSSGYDLKANSANSADWYCWTNEDQFAPIYHELDPLVVAQEQLAYSSETSQSASSPSSPYHMYQSIAEVRKEVEQLKSGIADQVGRPSLSLMCDGDDVTSGERHESVTAPSNQPSSTKWAIFSRLRLPRRSSPTASSKTSNGNDVTKVNRSTTMTRLSLSPGSFVRNQLATLEKMTSPPHERIGIASPPSLPADRKQNSPSSPLRRSVDENNKPAASSRRYEDSRNPPLALLSRALSTTIDVAAKSVFPFPLPMTPVEFARTPSTLRRATSGDVFFGAETPATARRRAEEQSVNRRPHSDGRKPIASGFLSPATSSLAFPLSSSGTFSSPCCGVRMAEMRAATRRSSITSVTSPECGQMPDSTSSNSIVAACVSPVSSLQTAERSAADDVILDTFALQQLQTRVANVGGSSKEIVAPPLPATVASLDTISEEDSSSSRHYYVSIQTSSMGAATSTTTTTTFEQAREHSRDPVSGVGSRSRWTSKSPDESRLHSLALTDDRLTSGCGHRSRLASAQHRVRHQSADGCRKHSPTAVIDRVLSPPSAGGCGARRDTMTSPAAMNVEMNLVMKPSEGRKNCRNTGGSSSIPSFGCSDKNRISASSVDRNSRQPRDGQQSKLKVRQQHQRRKPSWELSDDSRSTTATDTPPSSSSMSSSDRSASSTLDSEIVPDRVSSSSKNEAVNVDSRTCIDDLVDRSTCSDRRSRPVDRGGNITGGCRVAVAATKKTSRLRSPRASSAALSSPTGSRTGSPAAVGSKAPSELAHAEDHEKSPRRQRIPQWTSSNRNPSNGHNLPLAANSTYDTVYGGSCASSTIEMSSSMTSSSGSSAAGSISATTSGGDCDSPDGVFPVDFSNTRSSKAVLAEGLPSSTDGGPGAITVAETADAATTVDASVDASVRTRLHQHYRDNANGEEQPPIGQRRSFLRRSGDSDSGWPSESARMPRLKSRDGTGVSRIQPPRTGTAVLLHADSPRRMTANQPSNSTTTPGADDSTRTATPAGIIRSETATSGGEADDNKTSS